MKNITFNLGGAIGAVLGGGLGALFLSQSTDRGARLFIIGLIFGSIAGNTLWEKVFPKNKQPRP